MDRRRFVSVSILSVPLALTILESCKSTHDQAVSTESEEMGAVANPKGSNGLVANLRYDSVTVTKSQLVSKRSFNQDQKIIQAYALNVLKNPKLGKLTIRCGGHSYIGASVSPGGNILDMSPFNLMTVDSSKSTIRIGGGCQFHQIATELAKLPKPSFIPSGDCPTVGIGGYISGGGSSRLSSILGMGVDKVVSLTAITFKKVGDNWESAIITASPNQNPDLFWGMMGGGAQFAIIADITFKYTVLENYSVYMMSTGRLTEAQFKKNFSDWEVLFTTQLAKNTSSSYQIDNNYNSSSLGVFANTSGDLAKLKAFASSHGATIEVKPLTMENMYVMFAGCERLASCKDKSWSSSKSYSVKKSTMVPKIKSITSDNLSKIYQKVGSCRADWAAFQFNGWSGAAKVANTQVSYPWRDYVYECQISVDTYQKTAWKEEYLQWVDDAAALLGTRNAAFINHVNRDILQNKKLYFGSNWEKLVAIKKIYDPNNVFDAFRQGDGKTS